MKKLKTFMASLSIAPLAMVGAFALVVGLSAIPVPTSAQSTDLSISGGAEIAKSDSQQKDLDGNEGIFKQISDVLLFLTGAVSVIMLITGGIRYVLSSGDQGQVTTAKNTILYAIIGIIVTLLAYAIVNFVINQFKAN